MSQVYQYSNSYLDDSEPSSQNGAYPQHSRPQYSDYPNDMLYSESAYESSFQHDQGSYPDGGNHYLGNASSYEAANTQHRHALNQGAYSSDTSSDPPEHSSEGSSSAYAVNNSNHLADPHSIANHQNNEEIDRDETGMGEAGMMDDMNVPAQNQLYMPKDGFPGFYKHIDHFLEIVGRLERPYYKTVALPENKAKLPSPDEQKEWVAQMCMAVVDCSDTVDQWTKSGKLAQAERSIANGAYTGEYIEHICWEIFFQALSTYLGVPKFLGRKELPTPKGRKGNYATFEIHMGELINGLRRSKTIFKSSTEVPFATRYGVHPQKEFKLKTANIKTNNIRNVQVDLANGLINQVEKKPETLSSLPLQSKAQKAAKELLAKRKQDKKKPRSTPGSRKRGKGQEDEGERDFSTPIKRQKISPRSSSSEGSAGGMTSSIRSGSHLNEVANTFDTGRDGSPSSNNRSAQSRAPFQVNPIPYPQHYHSMTTSGLGRVEHNSFVSLDMAPTAMEFGHGRHTSTPNPSIAASAVSTALGEVQNARLL